MNLERGFVLPAGIFLLVILALLAAGMVRLTMQGMTSEFLEEEGERAYQAAQAGLDAGIYSVARIDPATSQAAGVCQADTVTFTGELARFTVSVSCAPSASVPNEGGVPVKIYSIRSCACNQPSGGACACGGTASTSPEYVAREVTATVEP